MIREQFQISDPIISRAITAIIRYINRETDEISFNVLVIGTEVAIPHGLDRAPMSSYVVITEATTGQGVVYPGTTAWTAQNIYLTATATGVYHVRIRR